MNAQEVKKKMMGLWDNVFHDSKDYVSLIFDNYFNEKYIEYREHEGKIVSALLGVPYEFGSGAHRLKGLYLCGLATNESFRQKGLMTELLYNINHRCKEEFDFTFLIPSSDLMADFYHRHGYFNSFYRVEERYTSVHDFKNEFYVSLFDSDQRIVELKMKLFDEIKVSQFYFGSEEEEKNIIEFIKLRERKTTNIVNLFHSEKDLRVALRENEISGGAIFVSRDSTDAITGVAFTVKEEMKRIKIPMMFVSDTCSYFAILNQVKKAFPDYSISIYKNTGSTEPAAIADRTFGAANPDGGDLETLFGLIERPFNSWQNMRPYGMVKFLRYPSILKFLTLTNRDISFKLFLKDLDDPDEEDRKVIFVVNRGKMEVKTFDENYKEGNLLRLTTNELSELLCRKRDSNNLIMEAFGIPRLVLKMALMLD